jgi:pimeloyl-ACP methyl ester carboxylesterase
VDIGTTKEDAVTVMNNVVLVHGAWADGSSWNKIIPSLVDAGLEVTAVQLPLTSFQQDVATLKRAIALAGNPILLVGHSYGGAVITEAGTDPKVAALVYVAAFAPDAGESAGSLLASVPPTPLASELRPDAEGFIKMTRKGYFESFGQDLSETEKMVLYAAHAPAHGASLGGNVSNPAWKTKPSSYIIAKHDRAIDPALQSTMSARIGAHTMAVEASHLVMISAPERVAEVILTATR